MPSTFILILPSVHLCGFSEFIIASLGFSVVLIYKIYWQIDLDLILGGKIDLMYNIRYIRIICSPYTLLGTDNLVIHHSVTLSTWCRDVMK